MYKRQAVARAGHVAALDGCGDEALSGLVGSGCDLSAAADAHGEAELVGIDLLTGEGRFVPKSGEVPALSGADADGGHADRAVGVVGDAAVGGGDNGCLLYTSHLPVGKNNSMFDLCLGNSSFTHIRGNIHRDCLR